MLYLGQINYREEGSKKMKNGVDKKFITPKEAAALYKFSEGTLSNLRYRKEGPKYYIIAGKRKILYLVSDFEDWLMRNPVLTKDSIN